VHANIVVMLIASHPKRELWRFGDIGGLGFGSLDVSSFIG